MQHIHLLLATLVTLTLVGCDRGESPSSKNTSSESPGSKNTPSESLQVARAEFGLFHVDESGKTTFVPSKKVPLSVNQGYGWIVTLKTTQAKVKWREEFTLPAAPTTWGDSAKGSHTVSPDRKVSITEREVAPEHGVIFNSWAVEAGDPKGRYVIRVTIEKASPIVFEFDVE